MSQYESDSIFTDKLSNKTDINSKIYILIIYDIQSDTLRSKLSKYLDGFGYRVQKSAYEAFVDLKKYNKLISRIPHLINTNEDSVRIYKISESENIRYFGTNKIISNNALWIY